jgi:hypothetical protein
VLPGNDEAIEMTLITKWILTISVSISVLTGTLLATELTAPDGQARERFGYALSVNGNTLAITGAYESGYPGGRTVWVFQKTNSWNHPVLVAELTAANGDRLQGVAVSGNTIVAGAPAATINGVVDQGCAYVFVAGASGWQNSNETAQLTSSDGYFNNGFGVSVSIDKDTIVVGAPGAGNIQQGEAYIFTKPATGWVNATETAKLLASNGQMYDGFGGGNGVSINGVVAAVGAGGVGFPNGYGAVYVFQETRGGWQNMTETAELTEGQPFVGEELGSSVVIEGGTVVAGAPSANNGSARVMIYLEPVGGWQSTNTPNAILTSTEKHPRGFGASVAINPNLIIVGNPYATAKYKRFSGAAFIFEKPPSGWVNATQSAKLVASGLAVGTSVAASLNKTAFIGAPYTMVGDNQDQGVVFVQKLE